MGGVCKIPCLRFQCNNSCDPKGTIVLFSWEKLERYSPSSMQSAWPSYSGNVSWLQQTGSQIRNLTSFSCFTQQVYAMYHSTKDLLKLPLGTKIISRQVRNESDAGQWNLCLHTNVSECNVRRLRSWTPVQGCFVLHQREVRSSKPRVSLENPLPTRLALIIYKSTSIVTSASYHVSCFPQIWFATLLFLN
jgi:hypothetical protein